MTVVTKLQKKCSLKKCYLTFRYPSQKQLTHNFFSLYSSCSLKSRDDLDTLRSTRELLTTTFALEVFKIVAIFTYLLELTPHWSLFINSKYADQSLFTYNKDQTNEACIVPVILLYNSTTLEAVLVAWLVSRFSANAM